MKPVQGFQSQDGTFFVSAAECVLYETELEVDAVCESHRIDPTAFKRIVRAMSLLTERYIHAYQEYEKTDASPSGDADQTSDATCVDTSIDAGPEAIATRLLELSSSSSEHVRPVGSGECTEDVSREAEGDGARGWPSDASGVRRGEDMAINSPPKVDRSRRDRGGSDI